MAYQFQVAVRELLLFFQFIETVQSEKSEIVALSLFSPSKPTTIGEESPITPPRNVCYN